MTKQHHFKKFIFVLTISLGAFLSGCSKEEMQNDEEIAVEQAEEVCELPTPENGCQTAFFQGSTGWVKIVDPGEREDPYFLYTSSLKQEPLATVTVSKINGELLIRFNDNRVEAVLAEVSQQLTGYKSICELETNIKPPSSDEDPDAAITLLDEVHYPFYLKLSANVCP